MKHTRGKRRPATTHRAIPLRYMKSTDWLPFNDAVSDPRATIHYTDNPEVMAAILDVKLRHVQKCALIVLADCVIEIVA